jgi:hypothetical protein
MTKLIHSLRNSNVTGEFLSTVLACSSLITIWPMYLWIHEMWTFLGWPSIWFWCFSMLYYAIWIWLYLFLSNEYEQYPGMSMDAFFCGTLFAVASALRDADVLSVLSKKGFGAAAWVAFLSAMVLVFRNFGRRSRKCVKAGGESNPDE